MQDASFGVASRVACARGTHLSLSRAHHVKHVEHVTAASAVLSVALGCQPHPYRRQECRALFGACRERYYACGVVAFIRQREVGAVHLLFLMRDLRVAPHLLMMLLGRLSTCHAAAYVPGRK